VISVLGPHEIVERNPRPAIRIRATESLMSLLAVAHLVAFAFQRALVVRFFVARFEILEAQLLPASGRAIWL
jgi:hypothetical protein